ncbi:hypothetical protein PGT21_021246 [Puccinia graminis f. sp. tritici]|uniref:hAT-like transposase RNase-H fold domain-containing protein n=1 Tax=Puccinia graminis f. sp. tritici TaxID=56615 RepID=A0A5B0MN80_PUCGR|nr:hypothetical protein PGT21_021246 [Puccinia graminis f. sp. tritici]
MTKELSQLIQTHNGTIWDNSINHQRCFCHVLALILGAGLSAIKLSTSEGPKSKKPENFPTLETIDEEGELIDDGAEEFNSEAEDEVDPDDMSSDSEPEETNEVAGKKTKGEYALSGIGFTLKKVK